MTAPDIAFNEPPRRAGRHTNAHREARRAARSAGELTVAPLRRRHSLALAGLVALLTAALLVGARGAPIVFAGVLLAVQALYIAAFLAAVRPTGKFYVAAVALAVAGAADAGALWWRDPELTPIGYAVAGGFLLTIVAQLARRSGRTEVTAAFAATLTLVVTVAGYPMALVLVRHDLGVRAFGVCLLAAGGAVAVARIVDIVPVGPRYAPEVPRGILGGLLGILAGGAVAALAGAVRTELTWNRGAMIGLVTAGVAVLADLSADFGDYESPRTWLSSARGPLMSFALAIPVAYVVSVLIQGF